MRLMTGLILATVMTATTGCYVETLEDRAPQAGGGTKKLTDPADVPADGMCKSNLGKGCFDGHVLSTKAFRVDGQEFFNADDLSAQFRKLIKTEKDDTELVLDERIDNPNFAAGFGYDLTGTVPRAGKVRPNGNFNIDELPEGSYDLRVYRSVKFTLKGTKTVEPEPTPTPTPTDPDHPDNPTPVDPDAPQPEPKTEPVERHFCATLYTDLGIDIRRAKRTNESFGDFHLHVTNNDCAGSDAGTTLTL